MSGVGCVPDALYRGCRSANWLHALCRAGGSANTGRGRFADRCSQSVWDCVPCYWRASTLPCVYVAPIVCHVYTITYFALVLYTGCVSFLFAPCFGLSFDLDPISQNTLFSPSRAVAHVTIVHLIVLEAM